MPTIACPKCAQPLDVRPEAIGKECRCSRCGHVSRAEAREDPYGTIGLGGAADTLDATMPPPPARPAVDADTPRVPAKPAVPPTEAPRVPIKPVVPLADTLSLPALGHGSPAKNLPEPPDDDGTLAVPGYEVLGELGRGGMGVVYKARQLSLKRLVALKMIRDAAFAGPEELARFQIEAEAIASLQSPNIVQIYEIGAVNGAPYFSLELVEGGNLARKLAGQPLAFREAADLAATLARAVHSAHLRGVVHRDLKPANVLLTEEGIPKITDFGLAKQLDSTDESIEEGAVVGTPAYLPPEQAAGAHAEIGPLSDVYSLGAVLYELLTGRPPFRGESISDTLMMVLYDEPVPPTRLRPKVPRDLETICLKCLAKDPAKRYDSAMALAEDLQRWLDGDPIHARPMGRIEAAWRWCRRNPVPTSLLLAVTLGAAFGLFHLTQLSETLVQSTALDSARLQAEMLNSVNNYYSANVIDRVKGHGIQTTNDYRNYPGAIPVPATLTIELGQTISAESEMGQQVRMYSDYPFRNRADGGPRDEFERMALARLNEHPNEEVHRFEEYEGRPVLRYAVARVLKQSCVECHNTHPDSPKIDWKVGDVRGAVEIIRPLSKDVDRAQRGLRTTFILVGVVSALLLGLSMLLLVVSNRSKGRRM
jgi:serine/threonine protein kinase